MQTRQAGLEGTGEIQLRDLLGESLRMRPNRIIVGEVRRRSASICCSPSTPDFLSDKAALHSMDRRGGPGR